MAYEPLLLREAVVLHKLSPIKQHSNKMRIGTYTRQPCISCLAQSRSVSVEVRMLDVLLALRDIPDTSLRLKSQGHAQGSLPPRLS